MSLRDRRTCTLPVVAIFLPINQISRGTKMSKYFFDDWDLSQTEYDQLVKFQAEHDALKVDFDELTEVFEDVINQTCNTKDGLDNYCLSAYEDALNYLTKKGRITKERFPKWVQPLEDTP
jgi:hypothetical protein